MTSGAQGALAVDLLQSSTYWGRRENDDGDGWGQWVEFSTGADNTFTIPELLGRAHIPASA